MVHRIVRLVTLSSPCHGTLTSSFDPIDVCCVVYVKGWNKPRMAVGLGLVLVLISVWVIQESPTA